MTTPLLKAAKAIAGDGTLARFVLVGLFNTALGAAVMFGLYNLAGWSYWAASSANYIAVSILSFFLNKYFTFGNRKKSLKQALLFAACIALSYLLAYSAAAAGVRLALSSLEPELADNIAMAFGLCFFTACNYLGQRFIVFRQSAD